MNFIVRAFISSAFNSIKRHRGKGIPNLNYFLIMKLILVFTVALNLWASANVIAQKVNLSVKDESFKTVLLTLQKQTDYSFFIKAELLKQAKPVTVNITGTELIDALPIIFKNQPFSYEIEAKVINIISKPQKNFRLTI